MGWNLIMILESIIYVIILVYLVSYQQVGDTGGTVASWLVKGLCLLSCSVFFLFTPFFLLCNLLIISKWSRKLWTNCQTRPQWNRKIPAKPRKKMFGANCSLSAINKWWQVHRIVNYLLVFKYMLFINYHIHYWMQSNIAGPMSH